MKILHLANPMGYRLVATGPGRPLDPGAFDRCTFDGDSHEVIIALADAEEVWVDDADGDRELAAADYGFEQFPDEQDGGWAEAFRDLDGFLKSKGLEPDGRRYLRRIRHGEGFVFQTLSAAR